MDKNKLRDEIESLECSLIKFKNELLDIKEHGHPDLYEEARDYIRQVEKTYSELDELMGYVIEFDRYLTK